MKQLTLLETARVDTSCRPGKGAETCSFLVMSPGGWACSKGSELQDQIEARRAAGTMRAMGDNCSGPPDFSVKAIVAVPQFCQQHQRDILHRRLKIGPDGPWVLALVNMQLMLFTWTTANPRFNSRLGSDDPADMNLVLAEIGCLACWDHDGAKVAQGKEKDPEWPIDERVAALQAGGKRP